MNDYKVKGTSIKSKIDFVRENFGEYAMEQINESFSNTSIFPLLESNWYYYDLYIDILKYIVKVFYNNDIKKLENVGMFSAENVLNGVYKIFIQKQDYTHFLKRISTLHSRFYNMGEMIVDIGEKKRVQRLY